MSKAPLISAVLLVALGVMPAVAGPRTISVPASEGETPRAAPTALDEYRGYRFNLSENAGRKDDGAIADALRRQLDVVESAGFSPRVLQFFHSVPIVASEMACLEEGAASACYGNLAPERDGLGATSWDEAKHEWTNPDVVALAADTGVGVIMLHPSMLRYEKDPVILHEFLHAFHAKLMPHGYDNLGIAAYYSEAKRTGSFGKDAYALKNKQEFFAVTASIFLAGKDSIHEPNTRAKLKEQMPEYYKYLVGVFGFDPDAPNVASLASN